MFLVSHFILFFLIFTDHFVALSPMTALSEIQQQCTEVSHPSFQKGSSNAPHFYDLTPSQNVTLKLSPRVKNQDHLTRKKNLSDRWIVGLSLFFSFFMIVFQLLNVAFSLISTLSSLFFPLNTSYFSDYGSILLSDNETDLILNFHPSSHQGVWNSIEDVRELTSGFERDLMGSHTHVSDTYLLKQYEVRLFEDIFPNFMISYFSTSPQELSLIKEDGLFVVTFEEDVYFQNEQNQWVWTDKINLNLSFYEINYPYLSSKSSPLLAISLHDDPSFSTEIYGHSFVVRSSFVFYLYQPHLIETFLPQFNETIQLYEYVFDLSSYQWDHLVFDDPVIQKKYFPVRHYSDIQLIPRLQLPIGDELVLDDDFLVYDLPSFLSENLNEEAWTIDLTFTCDLINKGSMDLMAFVDQVNQTFFEYGRFVIEDDLIYFMNDVETIDVISMYSEGFFIGKSGTYTHLSISYNPDSNSFYVVSTLYSSQTDEVLHQWKEASTLETQFPLSGFSPHNMMVGDINFSPSGAMTFYDFSFTQGEQTFHPSIQLPSSNFVKPHIHRSVNFVVPPHLGNNSYETNLHIDFSQVTLQEGMPLTLLSSQYKPRILSFSGSGSQSPHFSDVTMTVQALKIDDSHVQIDWTVGDQTETQILSIVDFYRLQTLRMIYTLPESQYGSIQHDIAWTYPEHTRVPIPVQATLSLIGEDGTVVSMKNNMILPDFMDISAIYILGGLFSDFRYLSRQMNFPEISYTLAQGLSFYNYQSSFLSFWDEERFQNAFYNQNPFPTLPSGVTLYRGKVSPSLSYKFSYLSNFLDVMVQGQGGAQIVYGPSDEIKALSFDLETQNLVNEESFFTLETSGGDYEFYVDSDYQLRCLNKDTSEFISLISAKTLQTGGPILDTSSSEPISFSLTWDDTTGRAYLRWNSDVYEMPQFISLSDIQNGIPLTISSLSFPVDLSLEDVNISHLVTSSHFLDQFQWTLPYGTFLSSFDPLTAVITEPQWSDSLTSVQVLDVFLYQSLQFHYEIQHTYGDNISFVYTGASVLLDDQHSIFIQASDLNVPFEVSPLQVQQDPFSFWFIMGTYSFSMLLSLMTTAVLCLLMRSTLSSKKKGLFLIPLSVQLLFLIPFIVNFCLVDNMIVRSFSICVIVWTSVLFLFSFLKWIRCCRFLKNHFPSLGLRKVHLDTIFFMGLLVLFSVCIYLYSIDFLSFFVYKIICCGLTYIGFSGLFLFHSYSRKKWTFHVRKLFYLCFILSLYMISYVIDPTGFKEILSLHYSVFSMFYWMSFILTGGVILFLLLSIIPFFIFQGIQLQKQFKIEGFHRDFDFFYRGVRSLRLFFKRKKDGKFKVYFLSNRVLFFCFLCLIAFFIISYSCFNITHSYLYLLLVFTVFSLGLVFLREILRMIYRLLSRPVSMGYSLNSEEERGGSSLSFSDLDTSSSRYLIPLFQRAEKVIQTSLLPEETLSDQKEALFLQRQERQMSCFEISEMEESLLKEILRKEGVLTSYNHYVELLISHINDFERGFFPQLNDSISTFELTKEQLSKGVSLVESLILKYERQGLLGDFSQEKKDQMSPVMRQVGVNLYYSQWCVMKKMLMKEYKQSILLSASLLCFFDYTNLAYQQLPDNLNKEKLNLEDYKGGFLASLYQHCPQNLIRTHAKTLDKLKTVLLEEPKILHSLDPLAISVASLSLLSADARYQCFQSLLSIIAENLVNCVVRRESLSYELSSFFRRYPQQFKNCEEAFLYALVQYRIHSLENSIQRCFGQNGPDDFISVHQQRAVVRSLESSCRHVCFPFYVCGDRDPFNTDMSYFLERRRAVSIFFETYTPVTFFFDEVLTNFWGFFSGHTVFLSSFFKIPFFLDSPSTVFYDESSYIWAHPFSIVQLLLQSSFLKLKKPSQIQERCGQIEEDFFVYQSILENLQESSPETYLQRCLTSFQEGHPVSKNVFFDTWDKFSPQKKEEWVQQLSFSILRRMQDQKIFIYFEMSEEFIPTLVSFCLLLQKNKASDFLFGVLTDIIQPSISERLWKEFMVQFDKEGGLRSLLALYYKNIQDEKQTNLVNFYEPLSCFYSIFSIVGSTILDVLKESTYKDWHLRSYEKLSQKEKIDLLNSFLSVSSQDLSFFLENLYGSSSSCDLSVGAQSFLEDMIKSACEGSSRLNKNIVQHLDHLLPFYAQKIHSEKKVVCFFIRCLGSLRKFSFLKGCELSQCTDMMLSFPASFLQETIQNHPKSIFYLLTLCPRMRPTVLCDGENLKNEFVQALFDCLYDDGESLRDFLHYFSDLCREVHIDMELLPVIYSQNSFSFMTIFRFFDQIGRFSSFESPLSFVQFFYQYEFFFSLSETYPFLLRTIQNNTFVNEKNISLKEVDFILNKIVAYQQSSSSFVDLFNAVLPQIFPIQSFDDMTDAIPQIYIDLLFKVVRVGYENNPQHFFPFLKKNLKLCHRMSPFIFNEYLRVLFRLSHVYEFEQVCHMEEVRVYLKELCYRDTSLLSYFKKEALKNSNLIFKLVVFFQVLEDNSFELKKFFYTTFLLGQWECFDSVLTYIQTYKDQNLFEELFPLFVSLSYDIEFLRYSQREPLHYLVCFVKDLSSHYSFEDSLWFLLGRGRMKEEDEPLFMNFSESPVCVRWGQKGLPLGLNRNNEPLFMNFSESPVCVRRGRNRSALCLNVKKENKPLFIELSESPSQFYWSRRKFPLHLSFSTGSLLPLFSPRMKKKCRLPLDSSLETIELSTFRRKGKKVELDKSFVLKSSSFESHLGVPSFKRCA